jgi:hypothetical protein
MMISILPAGVVPQTQGVVDEQESGYAVSYFKTQYYIIVDTAPVSLVRIPC